MSSPTPKNHRVLLAICAGCTLVFGLLSSYPPDSVMRAEHQLRDGLVRQGRPARPNPKLVFLAIDKTSIDLNPGTAPVAQDRIDASPALKKLSAGWPLSRDFYPLLIDRLAAAGAKAIVFDLLFPSPRDTDPAFRVALDRYRDRVVIGMNFSNDPDARGGKSLNLMIPPDTLIPRERGPGDPRLGFVNFWPDDDLINRRARYRVTQEELEGFTSGADSPVYESLAARALRMAGLADKIPSGRAPRLMRFARPFDQSAEFGFKPYSLWEVFSDDLWSRPPFNNGTLFRDKIVLVGPFGNWSKDFVASPYGLEALPGPVMHLNAINAALNGDFLTETARTANLLLVLLGGAAAFGVSLCVRWPLGRFFTLLGAMASYYGVSLFAYNAGTFLLILLPALNFGTCGFTWLVWEQVLDRLERMRVRRTLERYVSKDVVREILDNPESFLHSMKGERKRATVLFTDIRGFTTLTEAADSEKLVAQLNDYFEAMVAIIFENKGSLDKFIGDAIMAVWGNVRTEGPRIDAERAVTAGLRMQERLRELNEQWRGQGMPELRMGVGVNSGEVIVGNLGSTEKMEVTVIGDEVNLASRLEGLSKPFHQEIVIGENVARLLDDRFHVLPVARVTVKNKTRPTEIFTVLGQPGKPLDAAVEAYRCAFTAGIRAYRAREFAAASRLFRESLAAMPDAGLAQLYTDECEELQANPPSPEWDGVVVMKSK